MASALSKEMEMMELQLNRSKEMAREAFSLREEAHSLGSLLDTKVLTAPFQACWFFFNLL